MPIILNGTGDITGLASVNSSVSAAEIGYLDGVSSAIQTQINNKYTTPAAWIQYTPSWTATGGTPSIGNGTLVGRYSRVGNIIVGGIFIYGGSTTVWTGTQYTFSLPVTAANDYWAGSAHIYNGNTGAYYVAGTYASGSNFHLVTNSGWAGATSPATWTTNFVCRISFTYEAA